MDEFHVGGLDSTKMLAQVMYLQPGMHLLDVGCGVGGPARYFAAEKGCRVTGVDLTDEFVRVAESLSRLVRLENAVSFRRASALELPFEAGTFDGAYMIHVGMNVADKAGVFAEVARVLKPGSRFTIFDIVRAADGLFSFPVPWAASEQTSFVVRVADYRDTLRAAGFSVEHERSQRQFCVEFTKKVVTQIAQAGPPALGLQLLMGEKTPLMIQNILAAMQSGVLEPFEIVATLRQRLHSP